MDHREALYDEASKSFCGALERLTRAYELDGERRRDLAQEIYLALWRSLERFDGRCSLRTWTFRVAHNVGASYVRSRTRHRLATLESLDSLASSSDVEVEVGRKSALERLLALIHRLDPLERQVMTLYLEDLDAASIGEVTGLSPGNVATRIHRIKKALAHAFAQEKPHE